MLSLTMVLLAASAAPSDLEDAVAKTAKLEGYEFVSTSERTGNFGGGRGGRGGRGGAGQANEPTTVSARVGKGGVMYIHSGEVEAYKQGTALVTKDENGEWALAQQRGFGGRGQRGGGDAEGGRGGRGGGDAEGGRGGRGGGDAEGGRGGRGGRGGGDAEGGRGGRGGGDAEGGRGGRGGFNNSMRAAMQLRTVEAPHETLSTIVKHLENVKIEEKDGSKIYTADLTADGVQAASGRGGRGGGGRGGFGGDAEQSGKAKITVNKDGYVTNFEIETKTSMSSDRGDFEFGSKQQCTLKGHGSTKVEVPEKIQKLLDSADEEIF